MTSIPRRLPSSTAAFTLIEILVTVVILGILMVLALPSYQGMVSRGQGAKCMGNLRQIGTAIAAYSGENDGAFPRGGWGSGGSLPLEPPGTDGVGWITDIFPYLNDSREVFICPSGKEKSPTGAESWTRMPNAAWNDPRYPSHYAYNAQLNTNRASLRNFGWNVDRVSAVRNLSGLPVMIDIVFQTNFLGYPEIFRPNPPETATQSFAPRHGNTGNVLWGDGHVSSMTAEAWAAAPGERVDGSTHKEYRFCKGDY